MGSRRKHNTTKRGKKRVVSRRRHKKGGVWPFTRKDKRYSPYSVSKTRGPIQFTAPAYERGSYFNQMSPEYGIPVTSYNEEPNPEVNMSKCNASNIDSPMCLGEPDMEFYNDYNKACRDKGMSKSGACKDNSVRRKYDKAYLKTFNKPYVARADSLNILKGRYGCRNNLTKNRQACKEIAEGNLPFSLDYEFDDKRYLKGNQRNIQQYGNLMSERMSVESMNSPFDYFERASDITPELTPERRTTSEGLPLEAYGEVPSAQVRNPVAVSKPKSRWGF